MHRFLICLFLLTLGMGSVGIAPVLALPGSQLSLPEPGRMVQVSPSFAPVLLKGIKIHPKNPFKFEFMISTGGHELNTKDPNFLYSKSIKDEASRLVRYFLAGVTIPEKDLWVNLSPYEKDRIVPDAFGRTEMGRDLLAQDYMLKQITASLLYPEGTVGREFWKRVYQEAAGRYGSAAIPVDTFNKVWIVPDGVEVYEHARSGAAYVVKARLKVLMEEDYLASKMKAPRKAGGKNAARTAILREVLLPALTKEVNEGRNFARLRQLYNSLILAVWYKGKIKNSLLQRQYIRKNKTGGIALTGLTDREEIYARYLEAFKRGVYNYVKDEVDPATGTAIPRKYFSGGAFFGDFAMTVGTNPSRIPAKRDPGLSVEAELIPVFDAAQNATALPGISMRAAEKRDDAMAASVLPLFSRSQLEKLHRLDQLGNDAKRLAAAARRDPEHWAFLFDEPFLKNDSFWQPEGIAGRLQSIAERREAKRDYFDRLREHSGEIMEFARWVLERARYGNGHIVVLGRSADPIYFAMRLFSYTEDRFAGRRTDIHLLDFSSTKIFQKAEDWDYFGSYYRMKFKNMGIPEGLEEKNGITFVNEVSSLSNLSAKIMRHMIANPFQMVSAVQFEDPDREKGVRYDGRRDGFAFAEWLDTQFDSGRTYYPTLILQGIKHSRYRATHVYTGRDIVQDWLNRETIYAAGLKQLSQDEAMMNGTHPAGEHRQDTRRGRALQKGGIDLASVGNEFPQGRSPADTISLPLDKQTLDRWQGLSGFRPRITVMKSITVGQFLE